MRFFCQQIRISLVSVLLAFTLSMGDGFDQSAQFGLRYGPNLSWSAMGNTPFVWGQWLPQFTADLHYTWLEPIEPLNYGERMGGIPTFLKMEGALEVSPFYAGYQVGFGLRPFKTNPQVEVSATYESFFYLMSNLEMVTSDVLGEGRIAETWNADYIVDNAWDSDEFDYAQLFDVAVKIEYFFPKSALIGLNMHYILTDISTDFSGKSYDYKLNMPVFSRDFILDFEFFGRAPISENVALLVETSLFRTGFLRNGDVVEKEALSYMMVRLGPHISWKEGLRSVTLEIGFWNRLKDRFYDGNLAQQFIVQLQYQGYFSFPIHKDAR